MDFYLGKYDRVVIMAFQKMKIQDGKVLGAKKKFDQSRNKNPPPPPTDSSIQKNQIAKK